MCRWKNRAFIHLSDLLKVPWLLNGRVILFRIPHASCSPGSFWWVPGSPLLPWSSTFFTCLQYHQAPGFFKKGLLL